MASRIRGPAALLLVLLVVVPLQSGRALAGAADPDTAATTTRTTILPRPRPSPCDCPLQPDPVCGSDGVSYDSPCRAGCAGAAVAYPGRCADPSGCAAVLCAAIYKPVCGGDGREYASRCLADCTGVTVVRDGPCRPGGGRPGGDGVSSGGGKDGADAGGLGHGDRCFCTQQFDPVCGNNGKTYGNACEAGCARVPVAHRGECSGGGGGGGSGGGVLPIVDNCSTCPPEPNFPVCGADGITYGSECAARCNGTVPAYAGQCADIAGCAAVSCPADYKPVCGANNVTYSNTCNAGCTGVTVVAEGECGPMAVPTWQLSAAGCPPERSVRCLVDPCSVAAPCAAHPRAACLSSYCSGSAYRGVALGPCAALFAEPSTGEPVQCEREMSNNKDNNGGGKGDGGEPAPLPPVPRPRPCPCPKIYKPVCAAITGSGSSDSSSSAHGDELRTASYDNECLAACDGARVRYEGRCADPTGCSAVRCITEDKPMCGNDGVEYRNECFAACTGVTFAPGRCGDIGGGGGGKDDGATAGGGRGHDGDGGDNDNDGCFCNQQFDPVCGEDNKTYGNACEAGCARVPVARPGECGGGSGGGGSAGGGDGNGKGAKGRAPPPRGTRRPPPPRSHRKQHRK
ncbi:hypothetical protein HYH02_001437 [Chlamydomonas schloesseri]|uniref:Kazal-like domain-containing protein n=1 Tax=Chlamydomonas schloesseri TaxID=2026947 RepID=A0A836BCF0_9CHLO|nr:hypothetical protein HYH02_001437 [Chlamydomonas schloesseri]|eukprot:KAG2454417.1 hypothetical protein HYH02_001437 [Chlamydomonas schloesseri]